MEVMRCVWRTSSTGIFSARCFELVLFAYPSPRRFRIAQSSGCDDSCTPSLRDKNCQPPLSLPKICISGVADPSETVIGSLVAQSKMVYCCITHLPTWCRISRFPSTRSTGEASPLSLVSRYQNLSSKLARPNTRPPVWRQEQVRV
jgi:hypothetical protein